MELILKIMYSFNNVKPQGNILAVQRVDKSIGTLTDFEKGSYILPI